MKVKVVKAFRDKHTGKLHKEGTTLNISKVRYKEICEVKEKLVEEVKDTPKA